MLNSAISALTELRNLQFFPNFVSAVTGPTVTTRKCDFISFYEHAHEFLFMALYSYQNRPRRVVVRGKRLEVDDSRQFPLAVNVIVAERYSTSVVWLIMRIFRFPVKKQLSKKMFSVSEVNDKKSKKCLWIKIV